MITIPPDTAYMIQAPPGTSGVEVAAFRLSRGMAGFEWSVYHGRPRRPRDWTPGVTGRAAAWALSLAYLAFSAWVAWKGAAALRLMNLVAAVIAVANAVLAHTELRYYALPRSVFWLTAAMLVLGALAPRARGGGTTVAAAS